MKNMIKQIPVPISAVALGITALGNLLQEYSEGLRLACGVTAAALMILLFIKMVCYTDQVREEFKNPIIASVSATIFMTLMQLSVYAYPYAGSAAIAVWWAAVAGHCILIVWYTLRFLSRKKLEEIYPTCFVTYVGIVVGSVTSAAYGLQTVGQILFWFGFLAYMALLVLITWRCIRHPFADSAKPLLCIYAAPMSLSLTGYLSCVLNPSMVFLIVMAVAAQVLYGFVLIQLPKFLKLPFYPSYAAFTFPLVITAFGLKKLLMYLGSVGVETPQFLGVLLALETAAATVMVAYTVGRYFFFLAGQINGTYFGKRISIAGSKFK